MKTPLPTPLLALGVLTLCILHHPSHAKADPKSDPAPEAVVRSFLNAIADQKVDDLRELLADTKNSHITQSSDPDHPGIWTETWEEWLKWLPTTDQSVHLVDKLSMTRLTNDLAVVTLTGHIDNPPTNFHAIVVLTHKQDAHWKITSWTQENTNTPAKP